MRHEGSGEGAGDAAGQHEEGFAVILALRGSCRAWRATMQWGRAGVS